MMISDMESEGSLENDEPPLIPECNAWLISKGKSKSTLILCFSPFLVSPVVLFHVSPFLPLFRAAVWSAEENLLLESLVQIHGTTSCK